MFKIPKQEYTQGLRRDRLAARRIKPTFLGRLDPVALGLVHQPQFPRHLGDRFTATHTLDRQFLELGGPAVAVFELGNARFDDGLKLAGIQVPPLAFGPAVDVGSLGGTVGSAHT